MTADAEVKATGTPANGAAKTTGDRAGRYCQVTPSTLNEKSPLAVA